jgi:diaminohydroxyphosphoribosylaminopyrimidine deaminase/5-amino-6-(5-phosphoribosylamino)uracil reductase
MSQSHTIPCSNGNDPEPVASAQSPSPASGSPPSDASGWQAVPAMFRAGAPLPQPWEALFGPLRAGTVDDLMVVGQLGQSLDGCIATRTGHSHYINGPAGLAHLHRLRALVDAVLVGVGTAVADDPQLTVRRVTGPNPARVVLDPRGRLPAQAKFFTADGPRRVIVTADAAPAAAPPGVETVVLPRTGGRIEPAAILAALAGLGFRRVLIEGGAQTVSHFLIAGCLDRLHVVVAPVIIGGGRTGLTLPPIARADQALRAPTNVHRLGDEALFDCDLSAQRVPVGRAKIST